MKRRTSTLTQLRKNLGFTEHELAMRAGWSVNHQLELEANLEDIEQSDADVLGVILGVDIDQVIDGELVSSPLATLLKGEANALDAQTRFKIAEAVSVALLVQELKRKLSLPTGLGPISDFQANADYGHPKHGVPERLALHVRQKLGLSEDKPLSLMEDVLTPLGVIILWQPLPKEIDALAIANEEHGAVIIANPCGAHMMSAEGRRITLAHELCHLLFDRPEMPRFAKACRIEAPKGAEKAKFELIERRARAFAPALLAPRKELTRLWDRLNASEERVHQVMQHFGLSYTATRAHLYNMQLFSMRSSVNLPRQAYDSQIWERLDPLPKPDASYGWLRGLRLKELVEQAQEQGLVSRRWADEQLLGPLAPMTPWRPTAQDGLKYASSTSTLDAERGF